MASYTEKAAARQREQDRRARERQQLREQRDAAYSQASMTANLQRRANLQAFRSDVANGGVENTVENRRNYIRQMPDSTLAAMSAGESKRQYADKRQEYMTAAAQRGLMDDQGYAARRSADANYLQADSILPASRMEADAMRDKAQYDYLINARKDDTTRRGQDIDYSKAALEQGTAYDISANELRFKESDSMRNYMVGMTNATKPEFATVDGYLVNKQTGEKVFDAGAESDARLKQEFYQAYPEYFNNPDYSRADIEKRFVKFLNARYPEQTHERKL